MVSFTLKECAFSVPRLNSRFIKIIGQLSSNIAGSIPTCGVVWSQIKAIYRFLSNPRVHFTAIVHSEQNRLITEMANSESKVYYHLQDTTTLNFSSQKGRYDLPCLSGIEQRGLFLHSSMVLNEQEIFVGLLNQDIWGREEKDLVKSARSKTRYEEAVPIETKESNRWVHNFELFQGFMMGLPNSHGISISDAESDFYEFFLARKALNVDLLVRVHHNRLLLESDSKLLESVANQACCGQAWMECLKADKHNKRSVELEIRFKKVRFPIPKNLQWGQAAPLIAKKRCDEIVANGHLTLYVVQAKEINAPEGVKPIEWTILTTLTINDYWDALSAVQKYALRWQIEIFHLVLKEGCRVENLQLEKQERLENAIAIYSIIAMSVLKIKHLTDKCPEKLMTITGFSKQDYLILSQYLAFNHSFKAPKTEDPTVLQFAQILIIISGGSPKNLGIRQLWKGLAKANTILNTAYAFIKPDT